MTEIVWITGASSGIGRALALNLAAAGKRVVASARRADALEALAREAGGSISVLPLDTTDAAACENAVAWIEAEMGPLALAILNAGTHVPTPASEFAVAPVRRLVETNLMGTVNCLAPALAAMRQRKHGHIALVASVAGYGGLPTASAYGATKAALINMCESLKPECEALGVKLQLVSPGFVRTPLTDKNPFPMPFLMDAADAAAEIARGLASDKFEIVFPRRFAIMLKVLNMLPYGLYFRLVRRATGT
ncbi:MAG: SDR family NAD(P)-dependent oxidoreductase [Alphaproteobacteria bacterium]|nr:SDR family NAD(P)-dependent oxidoreductase [Alphaproteobacteria bacterium]